MATANARAVFSGTFQRLDEVGGDDPLRSAEGEGIIADVGDTSPFAVRVAAPDGHAAKVIVAIAPPGPGMVISLTPRI